VVTGMQLHTNRHTTARFFFRDTDYILKYYVNEVILSVGRCLKVHEFRSRGSFNILRNVNMGQGLIICMGSNLVMG
jgi:hypothetical protein